MNPAQKKLAEEMMDFLQQLPPSANLDGTKDFQCLYSFEAERMMTMRQALLDAGKRTDDELSILDFGYFHGLVPEFLHRFFPKAFFTICDRPDSPIFTDAAYLDLISTRKYLRLIPLDLSSVAELPHKYDVIVLGEIVEHLDPTFTASVLVNLRKCVASGGVLLITTPNANGIYNATVPLVTSEINPICVPVEDKVMGYAHIHLWSPPILQATCSWAGWKPDRIYFTKGRDIEMFARSWRHWGSFKHQVYIKLIQLLSTISPKLRANYVMTARAD